MARPLPTVPLRIGGVAPDPARTREVRSPYDDAVVARVAVAGPADVEAALVAACAAAPAMAAMPAFARAEALRRAAAAVRAQADDLARTIREEGGKPVRYARGEVARAARTRDASAEEATRLHGTAPALDGAPAGAGRFATVRRHPLGVVVAITPFNFPLNLAVHKVGPALAAGNAVVLKPSEKTPATGLLLGALLDACGFPAGAVNVVVGDDPALGARLVEDRRPAAVSFTGSPAVGWALRAAAGTKRVTLELGGNAAVVVDRSADLEDAAKRVTEAAFAHAGQICISAQRVFVHRDVAPAFRAAFLAAIARDARTGDPADPATMVGPLISDEAAERVEAWVAAAERDGARVTRFGARRGRVLPPMVVEGAPADADVHRKEVFGPVVTLDAVDTFADGLARADDADFGLQAAVFTADLDAVLDAERRLTVGAVIVNDAPTFRVDTMPYGGERASGLGREGVAEAVRSFTRERLLVIRRAR
ncbi:MAG: aldehyde dehydrogenase family protein [Planctomycetia bacterium]|nr:aldehyde dehydrogenase family protein [Planctomycetia bacterium]